MVKHLEPRQTTTLTSNSAPNHSTNGGTMRVSKLFREGVVQKIVERERERGFNISEKDATNRVAVFLIQNNLLAQY